jgi:hypothetical protein
MVQSGLAYHVSRNGKEGDWYWEVHCGGEIIARGLAATEAKARVEAIRAASHVSASQTSPAQSILQITTPRSSAAQM